MLGNRFGIMKFIRKQSVFMIFFLRTPDLNKSLYLHGRPKQNLIQNSIQHKSKVTPKSVMLFLAEKTCIFDHEKPSKSNVHVKLYFSDDISLNVWNYAAFTYLCDAINNLPKETLPQIRKDVRK